jgi:hypothetical protein
MVRQNFASSGTNVFNTDRLNFSPYSVEGRRQMKDGELASWRRKSSPSKGWTTAQMVIAGLAVVVVARAATSTPMSKGV